MTITPHTFTAAPAARAHVALVFDPDTRPVVVHLDPDGAALLVDILGRAIHRAREHEAAEPEIVHDVHPAFLRPPTPSKKGR